MDHSAADPSSRVDLATVPVFHDLEFQDRQSLESACSTLRLETGTALLDPTRGAHGVFALLAGALATGEGATATPMRLSAGDLFADWTGVCSLPALHASAPSTLLIIPWHALDVVLCQHADLRDRLAADLSQRALRLQIAATPLFSGMDESSIAELARDCAFVNVARGDVVIREGAEPDAVFVVARGSLEVFKAGENGDAVTVSVIGHGASVGEMGVLTRAPRSPSVRARRSSILIRIPARSFDKVLAHHAPAVLSLARTLSGRLGRTTKTSVTEAAVTIIAFVRSCPAAAFDDFSRRIAVSFADSGYRVAHLPGADPQVARADTDQSSRYAAWLEGAEKTHDVVLCACPDAGSARTLASVRQADMIVIVGELAGAPVPDVLTMVDAARASGARVELALLRESSTAPTGTAAWLDATHATAHHHLETGNGLDYARLARRITGRGWGLVLGGGGARALSHIGVLRAVRKAGMPIDMVAGTSMGAILSAQYAMGSDDRQMLDMTRRAYTGRSGPPDLTAPFVSMRSGRSTAARLRSMFGERNVEDLPLNYFCVSCNLTKACVEFHDRGPLSLWTRASCSVPGLLPPLARDGSVLVDGGLLNNLPVEEMRRRLRGSVVAADVSVAVDLAISPTLPPEPAWSGLRHLFRLASGGPRLPNILEVLMRSAEIASVRDSRVSGEPADLYLHVPLEGYTMSDFAAIDDIVEAGYEYTMRRLEDWHGVRAWQSP
jgi:predicted acylesterase/phospholipase RssA/CRP-like cAMP-binding protein